MVDLHSHVIDGIDDGAKSEEMAIKMLKLAEEGGTKKLICTPHYFRGRFIEPFSEVQRGLERLRKLARENNIGIELYCGQEIYLTNYLLEDLDKKRISTINNSRYMLIEMNMNELPKGATDILYELKIKGIVPIIAHPERYVPFIEKPDLINEFIDEGCLFQLNSGSLTGSFGKLVKKTAEKFLENGIYSFLGSDGHFDVKRNTDLREVIRNLREIDKNLIEYFKENGEKVILDKEIIFNGNKIKIKKRGLLSIFRKK